VGQKYINDLEFVKYLGIQIYSIRIDKVRLTEAETQKILKEMDKLEFSGFAILQMLKVIKNQRNLINS
jgi:transposase